MGGSRAIFSLTLSLFLSIDSFGGSWLLDPSKYELVRILPPDTHSVSLTLIRRSETRIIALI